MNIVVTGASNGIGYHTCLAFARSGPHRIFALSRNEEKMGLLRQEALQHQYPGEIIPMSLDLSDTGAIAMVAREISKQAAGLDILVNNAGKLINKPFSDLGAQEWKELYAVNVFGTAELTQQLLPLLKSGSGRAHIVNISSMGGIQGSQKFKGLSAYTSSKAAVIALTECLAEELREYSIAVNCLALGSVSTDMFSSAFPGHTAALSPEKMAAFIADFAMNGHQFFNGKTVPVSSSTP